MRVSWKEYGRNNDMDNENKQAEADREIRRACTGIKALIASRRAVTAEHNERIRKLRDLADSLIVASSSGEVELFLVGTVISPEIKMLLDAPTHHLWADGRPSV